jgi:hypothetical protein
MTRFCSVAFVSLVLTYTGCASDRCPIPREFADVANRNPEAEARTMFQRGHARLLAVAGRSPGFAEVIPGTSDFCKAATPGAR